MNIELYKTRLVEEKELLEINLSALGRRNPHNPLDWEAVPSETGKAADLNDQAEILESYAENSSILNELEIRYNAVVAALERIDAGTFGTCAVAGEQIQEARLHADPAATTCTTHIS